MAEEDLERNLGLPATIAISMGSMIGSGIFILPGVAYLEAGESASVVLAFLLGGVLTVPAALSAAELATAIPESAGQVVCRCGPRGIDRVQLGTDYRDNRPGRRSHQSHSGRRYYADRAGPQHHLAALPARSDCRDRTQQHSSCRVRLLRQPLELPDGLQANSDAVRLPRPPLTARVRVIPSSDESECTVYCGSQMRPLLPTTDKFSRNEYSRFCVR